MRNQHDLSQVERGFNGQRIACFPRDLVFDYVGRTFPVSLFYSTQDVKWNFRESDTEDFPKRSSERNPLEVVVRFKNDYFRTNYVGQRKTYHI